jgi:hypothetical protein
MKHVHNQAELTIVTLVRYSYDDPWEVHYKTVGIFADADSAKEFATKANEKLPENSNKCYSTEVVSVATDILFINEYNHKS